MTITRPPNKSVEETTINAKIPNISKKIPKPNMLLGVIFANFADVICGLLPIVYS